MRDTNCHEPCVLVLQFFAKFVKCQKCAMKRFPFTFTRLFLDLVVQATMHASPFFKKSAETTFENIFATSAFEFRFYFRQIMCAVSTAGIQHGFIQADLEAASKKSSHLAEALKSFNEEFASFKDDWARKVTGIQTVFWTYFVSLTALFCRLQHSVYI